MSMASMGAMRRAGMALCGTAALLLMGSAAQAQQSIKIGYAISKTGPYVAGATITLLNPYKLWVKDVNDAGGIMLKSIGKKVPIEVVEYDDRSNSEEMIKALERLVNQDKVDFILPPWGTAFTLASAPVFARTGYPLIAVTATTDRAPEFAKRWPNTFWLLGTGTTLSASAVEVFSKLRADGKIGGKVALVGVADQFGIELSAAARKSLQAAKFELVYDKSYPLGSQDMQPILTEAKRLNPDVFFAASYPPDTFAITAQAKIVDFNPKVFFTAVGTAFPIFKKRFAADLEGIMGTGGVNADSQGWKDYLKRHVAALGGEPDRWASPVTYSSLQMLQQAIERVGKIDRAAVTKELQTGSFETVTGTIKLVNNIRAVGFHTAQWQGGEYHGIGPLNVPGVRQPIVPKPAWRK